MFIVTFVIVAVLCLLAAILFGRGLVRLYQDNEAAHGLITSGFTVGIWGIVVAAVIFGFFNL
jgi:hypothetical protein